MNFYESHFAAKSRRRRSCARRRQILFYLSVFGFTAVFVMIGLAAIDHVLTAGSDFMDWLLNSRRR